MSDTLIKVEGLYKKFSQNLKLSMVYGTADTLRSMVGITPKQDRLRKSEFWALQDINFELKRGEVLGLVGRNGCGKTTLLRVLTGIFPPDKGKITLNGRVGALIAVGAGFHPHMSGRENVFLNGTILGLTRQEIKKRFDEIIEFAEIGEFIDAPVATYSSGMKVRLGFAIAVHIDPDILFVDEVLAVGDAKFQRKCLNKIQEIKERDIGIILVSHNMQNIEGTSSQGILLEKGQQILYDSIDKVIPAYEMLLLTNEYIDYTKQEIKTIGLQKVKDYSGFGTDEVTLNEIQLFNNDNNICEKYNTEDGINIKLDITSTVEIKNAKLWITFFYVNNKTKDDENIVVAGFREDIEKIEIRQYALNIKLGRVGFTTGEYKLAIHLFDEAFSTPYIQGHWGYFYIANKIPTLLAVGKRTPNIWLKPEIQFKEK